MRIGEFDYYIYIDYSEKLIGYTIIEKGKVRVLLPKISRFRHYKTAKKRKLYLKNVNKSFKNQDILDCFLKIRIKNKSSTINLYLEVLEFLKKYDNCLIFVSVDNNQFKSFKKLVKIVDGKFTKVVKESELRKGSSEYQMSLVLDNLLNIRRRFK